MKRMTGLLIWIVGAFWGFLSVAHANDPIVIAFSAPLTGQYESYGKMLKEGADLAVERINAAGGIQGRLIELLYGDSGGEPDLAKRFAMKVVKDPRVVAELGDFTTTACLAAQPIYQRKGMVQLSPTASHPSFAPGSPYSFAIYGTQATEAPFMARTAVNTLGKKKIAVVFVNTDWGIATQKFFVEAAKEIGADIVALEGYLENTKDFGPVLEKLRAARPELLYLCLMHQDATLLLEQRKRMGWDDATTIMGSTTLYSSAFLESGDITENIIMSTPFFSNDSRTEIRDFVQQYEARYRTPPTVFAAMAHDAANLLKKPSKKAGRTARRFGMPWPKPRIFQVLPGKFLLMKTGMSCGN